MPEIGTQQNGIGHIIIRELGGNQTDLLESIRDKDGPEINDRFGLLLLFFWRLEAY
jgi:hypothetical protein